MDFATFRNFARQGTLVPVYRDLSSDTLTPVTAFLRLRRGEEPGFLFESVEGGERIGRYSFLGRDPFQSLSSTGDEIRLRRGPQSPVEVRRGNLFALLEEALAPLRSAGVPGLPPLVGGAVGYLGYDTVRAIERLPDRHARDTDIPDAELFFHDTLVAFDHAKHRLILIANAHVPAAPAPAALDGAWRDALERLDALQEALSRPSPAERDLHSLAPLAPGSIAERMESNFTRREFESAVERAREYTFRGDAFQIVLSQRFQKPVSVDPFEVYRCLRALNPSPYLFYLQRPGTAILGSSPETMVRVEGRLAMVRPIAGTRRRGRDAPEDAALEKELLGDEKELAEHRMLVDLGRNDIGRVARFGTVRVSRLEEIERYSHVMHIVSQVEGELRPEYSALAAFKACFPAGTVSGAPKIRAMEIIDELEPTRRGVYAGAVGYIDFAGNLDTCIAIRTLQFHRGLATVQAGAGIVADSVPEREYLETLHKASALYEAVHRAECRQGESRG